MSTLAAVQFWLVVGEIYTITQAKRVYAVIGLGSLLGAVAGGGLARLVSNRVDAHHLLLLSAVVLAGDGVRAGHPAPQPRLGARQRRGNGGEARQLSRHSPKASG